MPNALDRIAILWTVVVLAGTGKMERRSGIHAPLASRLLRAGGVVIAVPGYLGYDRFVWGMLEQEQTLY
jgi:hypothetical protein